MIPVIYLLDQIPFKNYNVYVSDSSNLFDKASVKENQKKDWSDEHGYDIDLQSRYHNSKTITIDCFIPAKSLKECIEKYNDFFNTLDKKGSRRLSVIANDLRMEYQVFRQDTAENKLIYDDSNAVGIFKLKLIENMPVKRVLKSYNQPFVKLFQDYFDEYLNNIQIGGRNLFLDSSFKNGLNEVIFQTNLKNAFFSKNDFDDKPLELANVSALNLYSDNEQEDCHAYISQYVSLKKNTDYILSFYVRSGGSIVGNSSFLKLGNTHYPINFNHDNSKKTQRIIQRFNSGESNSVQLRFGFFKTAQAWTSVFGLQIEIGDKATDWAPAPEDYKIGAINLLNQISSDNIINPSEKTQLRNKVDEINTYFNDLTTKQSISNNLQNKFNEMMAFSDFILKDLNSNSIVNSKLATVTLKSKKVLIINWGDGTEQYTSPLIETYSHTYSNANVFYPMILGDLDSITMFNSNATILWNRF